MVRGMILGLGLALCTTVFADSKRQLDIEACKHWPLVGESFYFGRNNPQIEVTSNAKFAAYCIDEKSDDPKVVVRSLESQWRMLIDGYQLPRLSADGSQAIFGPDKKGNLTIVTLGGEKTVIQQTASAVSSTIGEHSWLVYQLVGPKNEVIATDLNGGAKKLIEGVRNYAINKQGTVLVADVLVNEGGAPYERLLWIGLPGFSTKTIWNGDGLTGLQFDETGRQLIFASSASAVKLGKPVVWYYLQGEEEARKCLDSDTPGMSEMLTPDIGSLKFDGRNHRIFLNLLQENRVGESGERKDGPVIWSYADPKLYFRGQKHPPRDGIFSMVDLSLGRLLQLTDLHDIREDIIDYGTGSYPDAILSYRGEGYWTEWYWNAASRVSYFVTSLRDGSRREVEKNAIPDVPRMISPSGEFFVRYDPTIRHYRALELDSGEDREIGRDIATSLVDDNYSDESAVNIHTVGIAGWVAGTDTMLIYDDYDIWRVDLRGSSRSTNVTNGFGRRKGVKLRLASDQELTPQSLRLDETLLLTGFDTASKYNGFLKKQLNREGDPEILTMGPYTYDHVRSQSPAFTTTFEFPPLRVGERDTWVIKRMSTNESPNFYLTTDFKSLTPITDSFPERDFVLPTAELVHWKAPNGHEKTGVLYKPGDFDEKRKYPAIFNYYKTRSDEIYNYCMPELTDSHINIPYFTAKGYLVFIPDLVNIVGNTGNAVAETIDSAAQYLATKPWVDPSKFGLQGHSWGGHVTNYMVTHSLRFAAAAEFAGTCDTISAFDGYIGVPGQFKRTRYDLYEGGGQAGNGGNLWETPQTYIADSPVLMADRVITPLLITHNERDNSVPFAQGVEMFLALRRLGKHAWLLQYENSGHTLVSREAEDYTIRLSEFFGYYLKEAPEPSWMKNGGG